MTTVCTGGDYRLVNPAAQVARKIVTVTIADTATNGSANAPINGRILAIVADVPDLTGVAETLAIDIQDEDGTNLFAQKATIAENTKTRLDYQAAATPHGCICYGTTTFKCTASAGAQTGAKTIYLIVYYI